MVHSLKVFSLNLLKDERGIFQLIPAVIGAFAATATQGIGALVGLAGSVAGSVIGALTSPKDKHPQRTAALLAFQQERAREAAEIAKIDKTAELEKLKLETFKAEQFQRGPISGPYFQVVRKK